MAHSAAQGFVGFLRGFPADQIPIIFEVISNTLFPDHRGGSLFQAGATDPLLQPEQTLNAAVRDLRMAEALLPQAEPCCQTSPEHWPPSTWDPEAGADVTTGIGRATGDVNEATPAVPPMSQGAPSTSHQFFSTCQVRGVRFLKSRPSPSSPSPPRPPPLCRHLRQLYVARCR